MLFILPQKFVFALTWCPCLSVPSCCARSSPLLAAPNKLPALVCEQSLRNSFLGYSAVYSYLSCAWVCLVLQTLQICLHVVPPEQPWDGSAERSCSPQPLSFLVLPRELSVLQNCSVPCLCFLLFFFSLFPPSLQLALPKLAGFQIWPSCQQEACPQPVLSPVSLDCQEMLYLREL